MRQILIAASSAGLAAALLAVPAARAEVLAANPPLHVTLAERALASGRPERASELLAARVEQLTSEGERRRAYAILCRAYLALEQPEQAGRACDRAASLGRPDFSDFNNLGVARYRHGDLSGALLAFERAVELNPRAADVRRNLARARAAAGTEKQPAHAQ